MSIPSKNPDPPAQPETLYRATQRLQARGFDESFAAVDGRLVVTGSGRSFRPGDLEIVEIVRFEGMSDPGDASILFALRSPDGEVEGLYSTPYGPGVSPEDATVVQALDTAAPRDRS